MNIKKVDNLTIEILIVSNFFRDMDIPQRVDFLTDRLREEESQISLSYIIVFVPLTVDEYLYESDFL